MIIRCRLFGRIFDYDCRFITVEKLDYFRSIDKNFEVLDYIKIR